MLTGLGISRFAPVEIGGHATAPAWTGEGEMWPGGFSSSHFSQQPGIRLCKQQEEQRSLAGRIR